MSREDAEKLLGGYATGTLTPEERQALFAAALEDQDLYDALIREEPLRELLQDPAAKTRLRAALETTRVPWYRAWRRPAALTAAVAAVAVIAVVVERRTHQPARPVLIARAPRIEPTGPVPSPLPQVLELKKVPAVREQRKAIAAKARVKPKPDLREPAEAALIPAAEPPQEQAAVAQAAPPPPASSAPPPVSLPPAAVNAFEPRAADAGRLQARGGGAGVGGLLPLPDARVLFSAAPLSPNARMDFLNAGIPNRGPARTGITATVVDTREAPAALHLGIRYTVLRRQAAGGFVEAAPDQEFDAGDAIALRLEANDGGDLMVYQRAGDGGWSLLASEYIARLTPYTVPRTGALPFGDAGSLEFFVLFSRQPLSPPDRVFAPREDQQFSSSPMERASYVVSMANETGAQRLGFAITLRRK